MKRLIVLLVLCVPLSTFAETVCTSGYGWGGVSFLCYDQPSDTDETQSALSDLEPFPWTRAGTGFERKVAFNSAYNQAVIACNEVDLVLDTNQYNVNYGKTYAQTCSPLDYCHTAHIHFRCDDPPPRTASRWIYGVKGPLVCTDRNANPVDLPSRKAWGAVARERCSAINELDWWLDDIANVRPHQSIPTGRECGGGDGWYTPSKVSIIGDILCKANY